MWLDEVVGWTESLGVEASCGVVVGGEKSVHEQAGQVVDKHALYDCSHEPRLVMRCHNKLFLFEESAGDGLVEP